MPKRVHVAAVGWVVLTTLLLMIPSSNLPDLPGWLPSAVAAGVDLAVHILLFLILGLLVARSLEALPGVHQPLPWTVLGCLSYGVATELLQTLIPGRAASPADLAADALGLSVSILLLRRHRARVDAPFGLRPPRFQLSSEAGWVLLRAFGPIECPAPARVDAERVVALSCRLSLAGRIVARHGQATLECELGAEAVKILLGQRAVFAVIELQRLEMARRVAAVARRREMPLALLKFGALSLRGVVGEGSRGAVDLDLLADLVDTDELLAELRAAGFRQAAGPRHGHHLPPMVHPQLGALEVHHQILGVRSPAGGDWIGLAELQAAGLIEPTGGAWRGLLLPTPEVLIAHAVVHGAVQHNRHPLAYPLARMFADLIDLGWQSRGAAAPRNLFGERLEVEIPHSQALVVWEVVRSLANGQVLNWDLQEDRPETRLVRHLIAGVESPAYRKSLWLSPLGYQLEDRGSWLRWMARMVRLVRQQVTTEGSWLRRTLPSPRRDRRDRPHSEAARNPPDSTPPGSLPW